MSEELHVAERVYDTASDTGTLEPNPGIRGRRQPGEEPLRWSPSPPLTPREIKKTYASLPSSPAIQTTFIPPAPFQPEAALFQPPPFSLWDYLREELLATDFDSHQELKWERVSNFLGIPLAVEKIIGFGCVLCFDSFLHTFTILPIRFVLALYRAVANLLTQAQLPPSQKADILRALILVISITILLPIIDASKIYHSIRGQDTIKLYVIFNALEIADRLLTSIGQDVLDCMFSRSTLSLLTHHAKPGANTLRPMVYFVLSTMYTVAHAVILVYQLTALNVAINAYDNSLLTLLLSNQFVEIKGSVFKKFEKDNLFQITCADIVERFQLSLMLFGIAIRNLIELSSTEGDVGTSYSVLPKAFGFVNGKNLIWSIFSPVLSVLLSELVVDWLKHAFITKFNHIRPSVYERYTDVLCRDLSISQASWVARRSARKHSYVDQSPVVARRLGFASLPLAILAVLIGWQSLVLMLPTNDSSPVIISPMTTPSSTAALQDKAILVLSKYGPWVALGALSWLCLVTIKLIIGINLLSYASRRTAGMEARAKEDDDLNDYGRGPIGEGKAEQAYNEQLKTLLNQVQDDATLVPDMGETPLSASKTPKATQGGGGGGKRKRIPLEDLTRFTMVKRIW